MPRPARGNIKRTPLRSGGFSYIARFQAYGIRRTEYLGTTAEGWDSARADRRLRQILDEVAEGTWVLHRPAPVLVAPEDPTFADLASDHVAKLRKRHKRGGVADQTVVSAEYEVVRHLLPFCGRRRLSEFNEALVAEFVEWETDNREKLIELHERRAGRPVKEFMATLPKGGEEWTLLNRYGASRGVGNRTINKCLARMRVILEAGMKQHPEILLRNPAIPGEDAVQEGIRVDKPETERDIWEPAHVDAMLRAAAALDAQGEYLGREVLVAMLCFSGYRISEIGYMLVGDIDIAGGVMKTRAKRKTEDGRTRRGSKTKSGVRETNIVPGLRGPLQAHLARLSTDDATRVFETRSKQPRPRDKDNVRKILATIVKEAQKLLPPGTSAMPPVKSHIGRRTFISYLAASGEDVRYIMAQVGHEHPEMTLGLYAKMVNRNTIDARIFTWMGQSRRARGGREAA